MDKLLVTLTVIVVFVAALALGILLTGALIWLAWNVLGLHALFGLPALTFWQTMGAALAINILRGLLSN